MNNVTFLLIIIGNLILKLTDDFQDEVRLHRYKKYVPIGLLVCYILALFIILTPEGMLLTGSFAITSPVRKKTDNKKYLITLFALICSFLTIYYISFFQILGEPLLEEHFLSYDFMILFFFFILAVLLTHFMYEKIVPLILEYYFINPIKLNHAETKTFKEHVKTKFITVIICLTPFHILIMFPWIFGLISGKAFFASILSFFSYESATLLTYKIRS